MSSHHTKYVVPIMAQNYIAPQKQNGCMTAPKTAPRNDPLIFGLFLQNRLYVIITITFELIYDYSKNIYIYVLFTENPTMVDSTCANSSAGTALVYCN